MLADPRSVALAQAFRRTCAQIRLLCPSALGSASISIDGLPLPRRRQKPLRLFDDVIRTRRSIWDLLESDSTIVDERLASRYGWTWRTQRWNCTDSISIWIDHAASSDTRAFSQPRRIQLGPHRSSGENGFSRKQHEATTTAHRRRVIMPGGDDRSRTCTTRTCWPNWSDPTCRACRCG